MCAAGADDAAVAERSRKCNRSYAAGFMQRVLPRLALFLGDFAAVINDAIAVLGATSQRFVPGLPGRGRCIPIHRN